MPANSVEPSHNDNHGQDQWTPEREFATLVALMRCADRWTAVRAQAMFRWRARQCVEGAEQAILAMQATHEQRRRWLEVWRKRQARLRDAVGGQANRASR